MVSSLLILFIVFGSFNKTCLHCYNTFWRSCVIYLKSCCCVKVLTQRQYTKLLALTVFGPNSYKILGESSGSSVFCKALKHLAPLKIPASKLENSKEFEVLECPGDHHRQVLYSVTLWLISSRTRRTVCSNSASSAALASRMRWLDW